MLSQNQLQEIKEHLEASQNPLFFFDNDVDGLCAFLILRRAIGRGRGVAIKSFPDLKEQYLRKVEELMPDAIFILDKAELSKEFAEEVEQKGIPMIWIDHHKTNTPKEIIKLTSPFTTLSKIFLGFPFQPTEETKILVSKTIFVLPISLPLPRPSSLYFFL